MTTMWRSPGLLDDEKPMAHVSPSPQLTEPIVTNFWDGLLRLKSYVTQQLIAIHENPTENKERKYFSQ